MEKSTTHNPLTIENILPKKDDTKRKFARTSSIQSEMQMYLIQFLFIVDQYTTPRIKQCFLCFFNNVVLLANILLSHVDKKTVFIFIFPKDNKIICLSEFSYKIPELWNGFLKKNTDVYPYKIFVGETAN